MSSIKKGFKAPVLKNTGNEAVDKIGNSEVSDSLTKEQKHENKGDNSGSVDGPSKSKKVKKEKAESRDKKSTDIEGVPKKEKPKKEIKKGPANPKIAESKLKKPEKSLTNSQYEDIFESVLAYSKGNPNSQHNTPGNEECKGNFEENTPIKQKDGQSVPSNSLSENKDLLATPKKEKPQQNNSETPKSQHKPSSQSSVWGSHFRKNPSQVSSLLKDFQESQKSLMASSSLLSPETTASSSDNEEDGEVLPSQNSVRQLSQDFQESQKSLMASSSLLSPETTASSSDNEEDGEVLPSQNSVRQLSQVSGFGSQNLPKSAVAAVITTDQRTRLEHLQQARNVGLWVFCCRPSCQKQRYLASVTDPQDVPELWYCHMNPDAKYNHCQAAEQQLSEEEEEDMIYNEFTAGSVVWARVAGYPWWPAMVDDDPDLEQYYWLEEDLKTVTHYHVVFFDEVTVTRAWVNLKNITSYAKNENRYKTTRTRGLDYKRRVMVAKEQANDAVTLTTTMRLKIYSFIARYKGPITTSAKDVKRTLTKYKLKINVSKKTRSKENMSPVKEKRRSKKKSADKTGNKEVLNDAAKAQKKKRNQKDSIPNEEEKKSTAKKVVVQEKRDDSLKRKQEEDSDSENRLPVKKRLKSLFEKKVEKLMKKRKPRSDLKKVPTKDDVDHEESTEESSKTTDKKTSDIKTVSEKLKHVQEPEENNLTSDKSEESKVEECESKSVDPKVSSPKSNKSAKSSTEKKGSQRVNQDENNLEEASKQTSIHNSLFVDTSKPELNVYKEVIATKETEPQPGTSALAGSETPSGMAEVSSKHLYNHYQIKTHQENTEDSISSFVEPSQAQVVERDDLQEEKHSQSTIADFMANLSEDAVVPEAPLSQLSEPFEE